MTTHEVHAVFDDLFPREELFQRGQELDTYTRVLDAYLNREYAVSAQLCEILYEKVFLSHLSRATAYPPGFVPSPDNLGEQLNHRLTRERALSDNPPAFSAITEQLVQAGVLGRQEKGRYDGFHQTVCLPVSESDLFELYEYVLGGPPLSVDDLELQYGKIWKRIAGELIDELYQVTLRLGEAGRGSVV